MHISNCFFFCMQHSNSSWSVKNIDHGITSLNIGPFNGKIGSRLQIALFFLFFRNFQLHLPPPHHRLFRPPRFFDFT